MNIVIIGESVTRLPDELLEAMPDVEWRKIKGLRNMIAHDYFGIDAEVIWQIIGKHIPELLNQVQHLIESR
jgi:uncharacterized protein with HEPN domain